MNKNLRKIYLLFVVPNLEVGGAEKVALTLLRNLNKERFTINIIVIGKANPILLRVIPDHVKVQILNYSSVKVGVPRLLKIIYHQKPDILFSNLSHLNLALSIFKTILPKNTKLLVRESNIVTENVKFFPFSSLFVFLYRCFYRQCDLILCQSEEMLKDLKLNFFVPEQKLRILPNPVDVENLKKKASEKTIPRAKNKKIFVAAGRFHHQKGFDILIDAVARLQEYNFELWILGDGELRGDLEEQVKQHRLVGKVKFLGFLENPLPYIRVADAFVLSSRFEGVPNVVLEALTLDIPIISTPSPGGVIELIENNEFCIFSESIDAQSFSVAMERFITRDKKYKVFFEKINSHRVENVVAELSVMIESLVDADTVCY